MAEVFLARYAGPEGFEKQLVIKRVLPKIGESPRLLRMFFEEAKTQVSFSHGNLVSVFDFGRVENEYFIAMDYVRGVDFASLLAAERAIGQQLAGPLLATVGIEICRGLAYVHARGFVHRDVSPRNLLLSVDGEVKLSDFGLVLEVQRQIEPGRPGTPSYMAPEQARGDRVDARTDIYSLGLILAEGLLGRSLRGDPDGAGKRDASALADLATHGALGTILLRALADAPSDRFSSAEEMLGAFEDEIARAGAARERLVRELAGKVSVLTPTDDPDRPVDSMVAPPPRGATFPTALDGESIRENYFRDHRSQAFVDEVLEPAPASTRKRGVGRVAALVAAGALIVAGGLVVRGMRAGQTAQSSSGAVPAPPSAPPQQSAPSRSLSAPAASGTQAPTSPSASAPSRISPRPRASAAAPTGSVRIFCTPWCVPYLDGKAGGSDGRSFLLRIPAGRHQLEARRLEDRLQRQLDVTPGQEQSIQFDFDDVAR